MNKRLGAILAATVIACGVAPAAASASIVNGPPDNMARISLSKSGHLINGGTAVTVKVKFTCPAGKQYTLDLDVQQRPTSYPYGEGTFSGVCTGKKQVITEAVPNLDVQNYGPFTKGTAVVDAFVYGGNDSENPTFHGSDQQTRFRLK